MKSPSLAKPPASAAAPSAKRPRQPSRGPGVARFQQLLDATEDLLLELNPDDLGLYQIAEKANIPPASVYHFFPTKEAAFVALAEKYHGVFHQLIREPAPARRLISWQDLLAIRHERAVAYYNGHLPASKILLGAPPSGEIHKADAYYNESTAPTVFDYFDRIFVMPHVPAPDFRFEVMLGLADSVWSISFSRFGTITRDYAEEATRACIAYCRTFLPERVERRPEIDVAAAGDALVPLG